MTKPPRVLLVHNRYLQRGGEDVVVDQEFALLRSRGHEVQLFERSTEELAGSPVRMARDLVWNPGVARDFGAVVAGHRPDVIHIHNTFPFISPAVHWVAARASVPIVQTLHNFRLVCPEATLQRGGKICEACLGRLPWRAGWYGCYRGSRLYSAGLAAMLTGHRAVGTWHNKVDAYIALTEFARRKFVAAGLPKERIAVRPNFAELPASAPQARSGFLYVGRLSPEKGVNVMAKAAAKLDGAEIRVIGSGPDAAQLQGIGALQLLGALPREAVPPAMQRATALLLPSICFESFPLVIVEAFACGLPVIASDLGALPQLVDDGLTGLIFRPGDPEDLAAKVRWAAENPEAMAAMGRNARRKYEAEYTAQRSYEQLMSIYANLPNGARAHAAPEVASRSRAEG